MTSKTALLLLGGAVTAEAFIASSLPGPALRRPAALAGPCSSLKMVAAGKKSWQELAEALGNPFVPPQDKPALLQELLDAERREEIRDSVTKVGPTQLEFFLLSHDHFQHSPTPPGSCPTPGVGLLFLAALYLAACCTGHMGRGAVDGCGRGRAVPRMAFLGGVAFFTRCNLFALWNPVEHSPGVAACYALHSPLSAHHLRFLPPCCRTNTAAAHPGESKSKAPP